MSAEAPKFVLMRVNAAGYSGEPISMLCTFDPATDILLALKVVPYESEARAGFLHVTTQERDKTQDALFTEAETRDAIVAYFSLEAGGLINLADPVRRFDPKNMIERDGMDEGGMKYLIRSEITNGQYAVLVACYYARKQRDVAALNDFADNVLFEV